MSLTIPELRHVRPVKKLGYEIVLVNSNPATIMTDPETADVTYIEPLNVERLTQIIEKERPDALLPEPGRTVEVLTFVLNWLRQEFWTNIT